MNGRIRLGVVASVAWIVGAWLWAESQVAQIDADIAAESYQDCSRYSELYEIDNCEKMNELTRSMAASENYVIERAELFRFLLVLALVPLLAIWLGGFAVFWIRRGSDKGKAK